MALRAEEARAINELMVSRKTVTLARPRRPRVGRPAILEHGDGLQRRLGLKHSLWIYNVCGANVHVYLNPTPVNFVNKISLVKEAGTIEKELIGDHKTQKKYIPYLTRTKMKAAAHRFYLSVLIVTAENQVKCPIDNVIYDCSQDIFLQPILLESCAMLPDIAM
jgi:hypothetical protein